ncbi:pheromone A receptor-domain-containing protein [Pisolithus albus]|nr:pheromone A receptor-domain-containing protein [Pisolithus albus]
MSGLDYPTFPVFAFLGLLASIIPLPWHLQAWNAGTCYYMMWTALACLNQFVNSIVWHRNAINWAPVWCDISIRIMLGSSVGIPAASLCINRRLYKIAKVQAVMVTRAEKRRAVLIDTLICVLFPIIFIALQYVNQGHRFDIYEDVGCYPFIYNTIVAFLLTDIWPIIVGLISAVYCGLSLRAFYQRRAQFSQFLSSNTTLTASRYFRLMALSTTELCCTIPLASFMIWVNSSAAPVEPWISWENTHYDFSFVGQYPSVLWAQDSLFVVAVQLTRWLVIACAFIFFAFFGFAAEARKNYRAGFGAVMKLLRFHPTASVSARSRSTALPVVATSGHSLPVYSVKEKDRLSFPDSIAKFCEESETISPESTPSEVSFPDIPSSTTLPVGLAV